MSNRFFFYRCCITRALGLGPGLCLGLAALVSSGAIADQLRSPYEIVDIAPQSDWRAMDQDNSLYIELASGTVVIELFPAMAPRHTDNIKALVGEGFYDGLSIYRVVEGFVAQGGDAHDPREPRAGRRSLPGEFIQRGELPGTFTAVDDEDDFAAQSGYINGFPIARDGGLFWMVHCPGAFALARGDDPASGGTEFYVVLGHAPRYLDRNVTVFGAVRHGMEHYQQLNRGVDASGQLEPQRRNPIKRIRLGSALPIEQRLAIDVMRTESASFSELVQSRSRRPESWFVYQPGYVDVCGVPVPTRVGEGR